MVIHSLVSQNSNYTLLFISFRKCTQRWQSVKGKSTVQEVGSFSHSWKKKVALTEAQRELKLITECPTRWRSKEMMIARVLEKAKAISQVLSGDWFARSLIPTWQDIDVLESKRSLGSFFKSSAASPLPAKLEEITETEISSYLMTPAIDGDYTRGYTRLVTHNCVPATSATSECLYSTGGNIATCTRSSLKPAKLICRSSEQKTVSYQE